MKMCKVPRKSLRRWSHVGCNRKKGCGRKTRNPEMENKLVEWYREEINGGANVSAKMIRDKAVEISGDKDFLASKGWLEKFKKKFGIRIATHKNKNFKKIISYKDKIGKINFNNNNLGNYLNEKENNEDDVKINLGLGIGDKFEKNDENISDNINEEENDENKNENLNENINEEINENNLEDENDENDNENINENGVNINIINNSNNSDEVEKSDEIKNKINGNISLRKPIFWKTKIDKGNNKKFNVFRLNTVC
jgi:hypothetical protein